MNFTFNIIKCSEVLQVEHCNRTVKVKLRYMLPKAVNLTAWADDYEEHFKVVAEK